MKVVLLAAMMGLSGCSLCLFNCGTPTESRTHHVEEETQFMQAGKRWFCVVDRSAGGVAEPGISEVRKALCTEVKP
jgi:hypothetical protein